MAYTISDACISCGACADECIECGSCASVCPVDAPQQAE